jgi:crotonobetainyl-CoA:carnitine CoA-transferase CaiB-like acyl-CoA transferase
VAMQEAAYATLTSQLHAYFETGKAPPRTGNASHGRVPLNVYLAKDGYVAMNIAVEEHWHNLLRAMGREDLRDDPRYVDNPARVANRGETDNRSLHWYAFRSPQNLGPLQPLNAIRLSVVHTHTLSSVVAPRVKIVVANAAMVAQTAAMWKNAPVWPKSRIWSAPPRRCHIEPITARCAKSTRARPSRSEPADQAKVQPIAWTA